jgi:serine/threonine-protein kinase
MSEKTGARAAGAAAHAAREDATGLAPGSRLDRYEIVRPVAKGGMGVVWLARFAGKHGFQKQVAIKTIAPELSADPDFRQMFLEEARISSRLAHGNVAQILDVGEHQGTVFIVLEWVEGLALEQLCAMAYERAIALPPGVILRVVADVCAGLHAAHELRDELGEPLLVVHRDIKPDNILVREDGCAKVIDFGVAKARRRVVQETRSGIVKGTLPYMAPEQACGRTVDRRADVWSLGAVLYRAFAHVPPFSSYKDVGDFVAGNVEVPPLPSSLPLAVAGIIRRALARNAGDRFATADEMRRAIEGAAREERIWMSQAEAGARLIELFPEMRSARPTAPCDQPTRVEGRAGPSAAPPPSPYAHTELASPSPSPACPPMLPLRSGARRKGSAGAHRSLNVALAVVAVLSAAVAVVAWFALR